MSQRDISTTAIASATFHGEAMEKRSHLGMAGHFAAMSEFLYRGYNVAVPSVDVGDDVYIVADADGSMWRLQVKTADGTREVRDDDGALQIIEGTYRLSRRQLRELKRNELFFMLLVRWENRWRFVLVSREDLGKIRERFLAMDRTGRRGRRPRGDEDTSVDSLSLSIRWTSDDALGWNASLRQYLDAWPSTFPEKPEGPGAVVSPTAAR
jgi:hypothetical protein